MKIISWNVNGIRAIVKKGFIDFVKKEDPDILCVQETKIHEPHPILELQGIYQNQFWNGAEKKGYSSTAIFSKIKPLNIIMDMGIEEHDKEGRVITLEFDGFFLVNVYTPNSKRELERLPYRQRWDADFLKHVKSLEKKKPVILCGDLNVAHKEIDLARPKDNRRNAGFTDEERVGFDNIVNADFIDSFRVFNKEPGNYTWWSYFNRARDRNIGWRIDYFCLSKSLKPSLKKASILPDVQGSDHCPISIDIELK